MAVRWKGDFSTGDLSQWPNHHLSNASLVYTQQSVVRSGYTYACRFEQRPGQEWNGSERQEIHAGAANTDVYPGNVQWYAWSGYFPSDFSAQSWFIFTQFRHTGPGGNPPLAFHIDPGTMDCKVGAKGGTYTYSPNSSQYTKNLGTFPLTRGKWTDFKLHVKWHYDPSIGYVEFWRDGELVIPKTFCANEFITDGVPEGAYLKQGIYRGSASNTNIVYLTGTVSGSTEADVVLAGDKPPLPQDPGIPSTNFTDDFSTQDAAKWTYGTNSGASNGQFVASPSTTTTYPSANNLVFGTRDLTNRSETIELTQVPDPVGGFSNCQFFVRIDSNSGYRFIWQNNNLSAQVRTSNTTEADISVPYDPVAHRWLRIRHAGDTSSTGTIYFEASPDGSNWSAPAIFTAANNKDIANIYTYLGAGWDDTSTAAPGSMKVDNFNLSPAAAKPKTETLVSDFAIKDTTKFSFHTETYITSAGAIAAPATSAYPSVSSSVYGQLDLTASYSMIEVVKTPNIDNGTTSCQFDLRTPGSRSGYRFLWENGILYMQAVTDNMTDTGTQTSITYDSATMRWWRFRESAGNVLFETSSDRTVWTQRHSLMATKDITSCYTYFNAGSYGETGTPGEAVFDNYNIVTARSGPVIYLRSSDGTSWERRKLLLRNADNTGWYWPNGQ